MITCIKCSAYATARTAAVNFISHWLKVQKRSINRILIQAEAFTGRDEMILMRITSSPMKRWLRSEPSPAPCFDSKCSNSCQAANARQKARHVEV